MLKGKPQKGVLGKSANGTKRSAIDEMSQNEKIKKKFCSPSTNREQLDTFISRKKSTGATIKIVKSRKKK